MVDSPQRSLRLRRSFNKRSKARRKRRGLTRRLNLESLERRQLLAGNVEIGAVDDLATYTRTVAGGVATYSPVLANAMIGANTISTDLNANLQVIVATENAALTQDGDILVSAQITKATPGVATLDLRADRDIEITNNIIVPDLGTLNVVLNADRDGNDDGVVFVAGNTLITTAGGTVTVGGGSDPINLPARGRPARPNGVEIIGTIGTAAGDITIRGTGSGSGGASSTGVLLSNSGPSTINVTTGQVSIVGVAGQTTADNNDGVRLDGAIINSATGVVTINGSTNNTTANNDGVEISGTAVIDAAGTDGLTPVIDIVGVSNGAGKTTSHGVFITGDATGAGASVGAITINGTSAGSGDGNDGIRINIGTVATQSSGNIELTGQSDHTVGSDSIGVRVSGPISTQDGSITIIGSATGASVQNEGVAILNALNSTGSGAISIDGSADGGDGFLLDTPASISSTNGPITANGVSTAGVGTAVGGAVKGSTVDLAGNSTAANAMTGLFLNGGPVEATVGPLQIQGSVVNGTAVFLASVNTVSGSSTEFLANGGMFMDMGQISSQNDIRIEAIDRAGADDDVVITDSSLNSIAGNIDVIAGDDLIFDAATTVTGNNLNATVDAAVLDPDTGVGGVIDLQAAFTLTGTRTYNGGADIDTVIFDGNGLPVAVSDSTITTPGAVGSATINFAGIEDVNFSGTPSLTYNGGTGNDLITLTSDPAPSTLASLVSSAGVSFNFDSTLTGTLVYDGGDGDDTLDVNITDGIVPGGIAFNGQGNASTNPGDQVRILGNPAAPVNDLEFNFVNANDGSIDIDGTVITYTGLEPVTSSVDAINVLLNYSSASETIGVTQPVAGSTTVDSTAGEIVQFVNPTNSLSIRTGGGTDRVNVEGVNLNLATGLLISDDVDQNDTLFFQSAASDIDGSLDIDVPLINVEIDLNVSGQADLGLGGAGAINTSAAISTSNGVRFFHPVLLTADTSITASGPGSVRFDDAIDGPFNLSINDTTAGGTSFDGPVGANAALASLTLGAGGNGASVSSIIRTSGNQTYNSPLSIAGLNVDLTSDAGGSLTFNAPIDAAAITNSLSTSTSGPTNFAAPVGGATPLANLAVVTGGPLLIDGNITVDDNISFDLVDTAAAGDDATIGATANIQSLTGGILIDVGDNLTIQPGASVSAAGPLAISVDSDLVDPDPGTGAEIRLDGTVNSASTSVSGGADVDTLFLSGAGTNLTVDFLASVTAGSIDLDGSSIDFATLGVIDSSVAVSSLSVLYDENFDELDLVGLSPTRSSLSSSNFNYSELRFDHPSANFTLIGGGASQDLIRVDGVDMSLTGTFLIIDDDTGVAELDSVQFINRDTAISGTANISVSDIDVNVNLSGTNSVVLGQTGVTQGDVSTSAMITSGGDVTIRRPVMLVDTTDIVAGANVAFESSIDGSENLNVAADDSVLFGGAVGGATPVNNLTVNVTAGTIQVNDVTTVLNQTYNAPVVVPDQAVALTSTGGGTLTFDSTIDSQPPGNDSQLTTSTTGTTSLGGPIGGTSPLATLDLTTGGPFTVDSNITTTKDVRIEVLDSAAAGDDLVVAAGVTIDADGIALLAGDDFSLPTGATLQSNSTVAVTVDSAVVDPDPGTGSSIQIEGDVTTTLGSTSVSGGPGEDVFDIRLQVGTSFLVNGNDPTVTPGDRLSIDGQFFDVELDPGTGELSIPGVQLIIPSGIESFTLSNVTTLTVVGSVGDDDYVLARDPSVAGGDLFSAATFNSGLPISLRNVNALVINGGDGDDRFTYDVESDGFPNIPVAFNGQGQSDLGAGDRLTVLGSFTNQTLNYDAPGTDGNNGNIDLDSTATITYTGLEPIDAGNSVNTILNLPDSVANNASLVAGGADSTIELVDNGDTFEDTIIPNPTSSLVINLGDQGDLLNVGPLDAGYAASMIINGGLGSDEVGIDGLVLKNTPGRGLDVAAVETLNITNTTISGNSADVGGGLRVVGGVATLTNVTITGNTASGDAATQGGGGIFNDSTMTISGSTIDGNSANGTAGSGGGILNSGSATLTLNNTRVSNNVANRAGGGIEHAATTTLTLNSITLNGNNAGVAPAVASPGNGGGLHVSGSGNVTIVGGSISNNSAAAEGGGLWNDTGTMTITNGSRIDFNEARGDAADQGGGGVFNNGGTLNIDDAATIISDNTADGTSGSGGGIFNATGGVVTITDATIDSNVANRAGGGIEDASGSGLGITLTSVTISNNLAGVAPAIGAPGNGGGLHVTGDGDVVIDGGTFSGNTAALEGGGLWNDSGTMALRNGVVVTSNVANGDAADDGGGGIFNNGGTLNISGTLTSITANTADGTSGSGGGIFNAASGAVTINDATIQQNSAVGVGGGIADQSGAGNGLTLTGVTISGNSASTHGGGIHIAAGGDSLIESTLVTGNTAAISGGGLFNDLGESTITNGTVVENNVSAGDGINNGGGGIFNDGGTLTITGATTRIQSNRASGLGGLGGGILSLNDGTVSIADAHLLSNMATVDGGGLYAEGNNGSVSLSGVTVDANVAGDSGGGALIDGPDTTIVDSSFTLNRADGNFGQDGNGGGLFLGGDTATGTFDFQNLNFNQNTARGGGGGLFVLNVDGTVLGGTFNSNQVTGNGLTFETGSGGIAVIGESRVNTVSLESIEVDSNTAPAAAGIGVIDADVTIVDSMITNNTATELLSGGGGIGAIINLTDACDVISVSGSTISGNQTAGEGGGIGVINGNIAVTDTLISNNRASGGQGGGIGLLNAGAAGTATIVRSTIAGNTASTSGGGIAVLEFGIDLENVTISGNDAGTTGGGIAYDTSVSTVTRSITFSTIASNIAPGGGSNLAATGGSPLTVASTIFDDGVVAAALGALQSGGNNLDSGDTSGFNEPTDQLNVDPVLGDLLDNGGPVPTHAIAFGSPAIDRGGDVGPATDARGLSRPFDGDDDGTPQFDVGAFESNVDPFIAALTIEDVTVDEDAGTATFTATLDFATPSAFTVDVQAVDGSAVSPADFTDVIQTLNFDGTPGEQVVFTVTIVNDDIVEGFESAQIELTNASIPQLNLLDTAQLGINDNDTATLTVNDVTVDEDVGTAIVSVSVDNAVAGGFSVDFATSDGSAVDPDDYVGATGTLNFNGTVGEVQTFEVTIVDDQGIEPPEFLNVGLFSVSNPDVDDLDTAIITINDNDSTGLRVDDVQVDESAGTATVTVTLNRTFVGGFTVEAFTTDGSAVSQQDYDATITTLTFNGAIGETQVITIPIVNDDVVEQQESLTVALRNVSDGRVDISDTATVVIDDDDVANFSIDDSADSGQISFTVTLDADVDAPLTIDVATMDILGQAVAGEDYQSNSQTLAFQGTAGETRTFNVTVINDSFVEPDETFQANLSNVQAGGRAVQIIRSSGIGTILDDDTATLTISDITVSEDNSPAIVTVQVDNAVQGGFTVDFGTNDGTAVSPDDYTDSSGTLSFVGTPGETETISIPVVDDFLVEGTETFTVTLSNVITLGANPAPVSSIDATDIGIVTIADPVFEVDLAVTIQESADPIRTGDAIQYTITLANNSIVPATDVETTTTVSDLLSIVSAAGPAGSVVNVNGGIVSVDLPQLGGNESITFTIDVVAGNLPGVVTVTSTATASEDELDPSDNTTIEQTLIQQANGIAGQVFCDANNSGGLDPGEEVVDTLVFIDENRNSRFDAGEQNTRTDSSGRYQFVDVVGNNLQVSVAVPPSCNTIPDTPSVTRSIIPVGNVARAIDSLDLDGDGDRDVVVSADLSNSLTVLENTPDGFVRSGDIPLGDRPQSVFAFEPDPDTPPTIVVAGIGTPDDGGAVWVTDGTEPAVRHPGMNGPIDAIAGDFNDDGLVDILSASFRNSQLDLSMGGSNIVHTVDSESQQILSIATGDLIQTNSGVEVAVSGFGYNNDTQLELFEFDPIAGLAKLDSITTPPSTVEVGIENIIVDQNGETNEIVTLLASGRIVVYPMNGSMIGNGITTNIRPDASSFDFGDFNRDGITDVAVANLGGQFIELMVGTGDGRFLLITTVRNVSAPSNVVVDDFNGDGFDDIAVSNFYTDRNIDNPLSPPSFALPSTVTILQLEVASQSVTVTADTVAKVDFAFASADPEIILDTNGDNDVTALDALRVVNAMVRQSEDTDESSSTVRADTDVDGDGRTSAVDALLIINYLARKEDAGGIEVSIDDLIPDDEDDWVASVDAALEKGLF